ncbi:hypothetical protein FN846DRAFT_991734, partial [Sphaerosporella brunnea]
ELLGFSVYTHCASNPLRVRVRDPAQPLHIPGLLPRFPHLQAMSLARTPTPPAPAATASNPAPRRGCRRNREPRQGSFAPRYFKMAPLIVLMTGAPQPERPPPTHQLEGAAPPGQIAQRPPQRGNDQPRNRMALWSLEWITHFLETYQGIATETLSNHISSPPKADEKFDKGLILGCALAAFLLTIAVAVCRVFKREYEDEEYVSNSAVHF